MRPSRPRACSARSSTRRSSTICQSGEVWPSPLPSMGSLLVIEMTLQLGVASQMSETSTVMVTGTSLWFGGHSEFGEAATLWMTGGVVSTTVTVVVAVVTLPEPSFAVNVTVVTPSGNTAGASLVTGSTLQLSVAVGSGTVT